MKTYYRDFYGCTASIRTKRNGRVLLSVTCAGKRYRKEYDTERGARIALGRWSDSWEKQEEKA